MVLEDQDAIDLISATLNSTSRQAIAYLDKVLAPLHLTASNYYFILKIDRATTLTQEQLFKQIQLSPSNVTRRLDQLINQGLIEKRRDPNDGRGWLLNLTEAGRTLPAQIEQVLTSANSMMFANVTPEQQSQLVLTLQQISQNLLA